MRPEYEGIIYVSKSNDGFSEVDPNAIAPKYYMYMFANTGDNSEPIASPSYQYMPDLIPT